jgi:hypothetical protein
VSRTRIGQVEAISKPGRGCPTPAHQRHAPLGYDDVKVGHLNFRWRSEGDLSVEPLSDGGGAPAAFTGR